MENKIITSKANKGTTYCIKKVSTSKDDAVHKRVEQFWKYKNYMNDLKTTVSVNDIHSLKKLEAKVHMLHGRHEVPTFWKEQLSISKTKIEDIAKKIQDKNLFHKYNKKLDTHISRGYAKKNSKDELTSASNKT